MQVEGTADLNPPQVNTEKTAAVLDEKLEKSTANAFNKPPLKNMDSGRRLMPGDPAFARHTAPLSGQRIESDLPQQERYLNKHMDIGDSNKDTPYEQMAPQMMGQPPQQEARAPQMAGQPPQQESRTPQKLNQPTQEAKQPQTINQPTQEAKTPQTVDQPAQEAKTPQTVDQPAQEARALQPTDQPTREVRASQTVEQPTQEAKTIQKLDQPSREAKTLQKLDQPSLEARAPQTLDQPSPEVRASQTLEQPSLEAGGPQRENSLDKKDAAPNSAKLRLPQPLQPTDPRVLVDSLEMLAVVYICLAGLGCYLFGKMRFGIWVGFLAIIGGAILAFWIRGKQAEECLNWQLEKKEGAKLLHAPNGETVEWLNFILQKMWRAIDPDIFVSVEDILEDTLQSIAPSIIKAVKVSDFDIGVHAPRVEAIHVFPPLPGQPEEGIFGEASFSFRAKSSKTAHTMAPPGLAIRFKTGIKAPIDIKAELVNISGNFRFKILTSCDPPFVSKATISFTSVPKIETSVMPVSQYMNVMRLPLIKTIVDEGVKLGFADLVDPKSLTVDIQALMGAASKDTSAIGVMKAEIRGVEYSGSQLQGEKQDFYVTLSVSKGRNRRIGKTRVLTDNGHPRWNENIYTLLYEDDITAEADVDVKLWDADKVKFDDVLGSVSILAKDATHAELDHTENVKSWAREEVTLFDGWAPIDGKPEEESAGRINYKLSFHPKYIVPAKNMLTQQKMEDEEVYDSNHRGGILSVQISEAKDLEIGDPGVISVDELKHPYSPNQSVNPYAVLYLNDTKMFETRAKLGNSNPHWNATTEQFVKDYKNCSLRISVKSSVDLERDPVLGTKTVRLADIFEFQDDKYKECERWIPLSNGIGFGKVLLSLKFKPIKMTLPDQLRGTDVGTLIIERLSFNTSKTPLSNDQARSCKAVLSLNVSPVTSKRLKSHDLKDEGDGVFAWEEDRLFLPLMQRSQTALYIHLQKGSFGKSKSVGRLWLKNLTENMVQEVSVGLYEIGAEKKDSGNEDEWEADGPLGQVQLRLRFVGGFSPVHSRLRCFRRDMLGANPFEESAIELGSHERSSGLRASVGSDQSEENEHGRSEEEDEEEGDDWAFQEKRRHHMLNSNIGKTQVVRKLVRGSDILRNKFDAYKEGFNSESRASRTAAKED